MTRLFTFFLTAAIVASVLAMPRLGYAQQTKQQEKTEKIKSKIKKLGSGTQTKVKVKLNNDSSYQGYVKEANDDDFVIVDKLGTATNIKYSDIKSIGGRNLSTGAKIAIGIGIGAGVTIAILYAIVAYLD